MKRSLFGALATVAILTLLIAPAKSWAQPEMIPGAILTAEGRWEIPCPSASCDPITVDLAGDWTRTNPADVSGLYQYYISATIDWQMVGGLKSAVQQVIHVHNAGSFPELLAEWAGYHVYCANSAWATVLVASDYAHYVLAVDLEKQLVYVIEVFNGRVTDIHPVLVGRQWVETKVEPYERLKIVGDSLPACADTALTRDIERDCPEVWDFQPEPCPDCPACPALDSLAQGTPDGGSGDDGGNLRLGGCEPAVLSRSVAFDANGDTASVATVRRLADCSVVTETKSWAQCCEGGSDSVEVVAPLPEPEKRILITGYEVGIDVDQLTAMVAKIRFGFEKRWDNRLYLGSTGSAGLAYASPEHDRPFLKSAYNTDPELRVETWGRGYRSGLAGADIHMGYSFKNGFRVGVSGGVNLFLQPEALVSEENPPRGSKDVWKDVWSRPTGFWQAGLTLGYQTKWGSIEGFANITTDKSFWGEPDQVGEKVSNTPFGGTFHPGIGGYGGIRVLHYLGH